MMDNVLKILQKVDLDNHDIIELLSLGKEEAKVLFEASHKVKLREVGNLVYFRGLIELSNVCAKDCFYCGIRHSNSKVEHYGLSDSDVLHAARFAWENRYGSVVIQAGELSSEAYVKRITRLIGEIKELSHGQLGITLSLGEQNEAVYRQWFNAGAHRYLLRIETTNRSLYGQLHPANHSFQKRLDCLYVLKDVGYQVGTGVMIGLPFQTVDDLADDLLFMKHFDVDMVGMGPYIEHADTPLYEHRHVLWPLQQRFDMSLKMVAVLRLLMPDINIAATTALQAIDPLGREKAVKIGANIVMPNITPGVYRNNYALYENKPCVDEEPEQCAGCLDARLALADSEIAYGQWGDSKHFGKRKK